MILQIQQCTLKFVAIAIIFACHAEGFLYFSQSKIPLQRLQCSSGIEISTQGLSKPQPGGPWLTDAWDRGILWSVQVEEVLRDVQSDFQHVQVLKTKRLGRMLVLDGAVQCSEADEAAYHEMIVHVPLCRKGAAKGDGKRALIIGGGDGGAAREILRHEDVKSIDFVDIDGEVLKAAKDLLQGVWRHPTSTSEKYVPVDADPRLNVLVEDGLAFVSKTQQKYDLIVVDASDPVGPGSALYTQEFYTSLKNCLNPKGAVAVQGGSFWYLPLVFRTVYHGLKSVFPTVKPYQCFTAVYPGGVWNLQIATLGDDPAIVDIKKARSLSQKYDLDWYDAATHASSFDLAPLAYKELRKQAPTLAETSQDLEDILAYAEQEEIEFHPKWSREISDALKDLIPKKSTENDDLRVAAFDADGTLWAEDAAEIFMEWMEDENLWPVPDQYFQRYCRLIEAGKIAESCEYVAKLFGGMKVVEIKEVCERCFEANLQKLVLPEMKSLFEQLVSEEWEVFIVTASPKWVVEPAANYLGIPSENVLGIEVEITDGVASDRLVTPIPVQEGKVDVLQQVLLKRATGVKAASIQLCAGNSLDDVPLLKMSRNIALVVFPPENEGSPSFLQQNIDNLEKIVQSKKGWYSHRL